MSDLKGIENGKQRESTQNLPTAILTGCIVTFPAILFLTFVVLTTKSEYYFPSYSTMGLVFFAASFLSGTFVSYRFANKVSRGRIIFYLFLGLAISWLISLLILATLSLTPLCVGQDNGDGNNDLTLCVIQVILVSLSYSPFALLLIGITSLVASQLLPDKQDWKHA